LLESEGAISSVCLDARSGIGHVPVGGWLEEENVFFLIFIFFNIFS
jgi:hypothetical protein